MGVAMLAVRFATRLYLHSNNPLFGRSPTTASLVKTMIWRMPPTSAAIGEEYAAASLCDLHTKLPVFLSKATIAAPGPPGVTIRLLPSTSGDSLYPQLGTLPPNFSPTFIFQSMPPVLASSDTKVPSAAMAKSRSPSTVGVPAVRHPGPVEMRGPSRSPTVSFPWPHLEPEQTGGHRAAPE